MTNFLYDIRYAIRTLVKSPGVTVVAVIALALGIGANTAVFSVFDAVLLRPLPFPDAERLVSVRGIRPDRGTNVVPASIADFLDWREGTQDAFDGVAAYRGDSFIRTDGVEPEYVLGARASWNIFDTFGVLPDKGRSFRPDEERDGGARVAVVTDSYWRGHLGAEPSAVGRTITIDGNPVTIVGVLPPTFKLPVVGARQADIWLPLEYTPEQLSGRGARYLDAVARIKPGVSVDQALASANAVAARLAHDYPDSNTGLQLKLTSLQEELLGDSRKPLLVLLGAVALVLLIACSNVANLLMARAASRSREVAIRTALGAGRSRLVRQFLVESVIVALAGGAIGLLVAFWGVDWLTLFDNGRLPQTTNIGVDGRVLLFTLAVSVATGLLFGTVPAISGSRVDLTEALKEGGHGSAGGARKTRIRAAFVVVQVALSVVLLVGSGLFLRSLFKLVSQDPGLDPKNVLTLEMTLPDFAYKDDAKLIAFDRQLLESVASIPGVQSAAVATAPPFGDISMTFSFRKTAEPPPAPGQSPVAAWRAASPDLFKTLGMRVVQGRGFTDQDRDGAPKVMVVNESFARKFFPAGDALGQRVEMGFKRFDAEIVGVVDDVRANGLAAEPEPEMYTPYAQLPMSFFTIMVKSTESPAALEASVRRKVSALDAGLPVYGVRTLEQRVAATLDRQRFQAYLVGFFAAVALLISAVGLYGVMSFQVAQRTREIGVLMALGAERHHIYRMIVGQGAVLVGVGAALGVAGAVGLGRAVSSMLFDVTSTDPIAYGSVLALVVFVALLACFIPARRATKIDPMRALRTE